MADENPEPITDLLHAMQEGEQDAAERVLHVVYNELRRLASFYMRRERPGHTLQPTALVHELYLKLFSGAPVDWQDRNHFFALASRQLRLILVDHARRARPRRDGQEEYRVSLQHLGLWGGPRDESLLALDEAMRRLEQLDERSSKVVELRFFGGLSEEETAEALGISLATMKRDWTFARAWLISQLGGKPR